MTVDALIALLGFLIKESPAIADFVRGLIAGDQTAKDRIAEILPEKSASEVAADLVRGP